MPGEGHALHIAAQSGGPSASALDRHRARLRASSSESWISDAWKQRIARARGRGSATSIGRCRYRNSAPPTRRRPGRSSRGASSASASDSATITTAYWPKDRPRVAKRVALDHRQHRHAGLQVIVAIGNGQAPEMRRRPQEQDQRQQHRLGRQAGGDRRGAGEDGEAARHAADHDVPPGPALEPDGVDHRVEEGAEEGVERGQRIGRQPGGESPASTVSARSAPASRRCGGAARRWRTDAARALHPRGRGRPRSTG